MNYWIFFSLIILSSFLFALLEIQIEGENGWASKLPTWKIFPSPNSPKFLKMLFSSNRPITGYHLFLLLFILSVSHLGFVFSDWSLQKELVILAFFIGITALEDFLWFVLNPHFGLKKFKSEYISWHDPWFFHLPTSYYLSVFLFIVVTLFAF